MDWHRRHKICNTCRATTVEKAKKAGLVSGRSGRVLWLVGTGGRVWLCSGPGADTESRRCSSCSALPDVAQQLCRSRGLPFSRAAGGPPRQLAAGPTPATAAPSQSCCWRCSGLRGGGVGGSEQQRAVSGRRRAVSWHGVCAACHSQGLTSTGNNLQLSRGAQCRRAPSLIAQARPSRSQEQQRATHCPAGVLAPTRAPPGSAGCPRPRSRRKGVPAGRRGRRRLPRKWMRVWV